MKHTNEIAAAYIALGSVAASTGQAMEETSMLLEEMERIRKLERLYVNYGSKRGTNRTPKKKKRKR